ncbi:winged helix-turn-helix transcriptional regulator [Nocardia sp. GCM10030253]|uniref:winged helix-turn-helix transcriptional regulator n=1 Tax=Nocardia sp. GCM10030253 TaxID=3273404 RepID=UPI00363D8FB6
MTGIATQREMRARVPHRLPGLVSRTVLPTYPPQVEYALTERGMSLSGPIFALVEWSRDNHDAILRSQAEFDAEQAEQTN